MSRARRHVQGGRRGVWVGLATVGVHGRAARGDAGRVGAGAPKGRGRRGAPQLRLLCVYFYRAAPWGREAAALQSCGVRVRGVRTGTPSAVSCLKARLGARTRSHSGATTTWRRRSGVQLKRKMRSAFHNETPSCTHYGRHATTSTIERRNSQPTVYLAASCHNSHPTATPRPRWQLWTARHDRVGRGSWRSRAATRRDGFQPAPQRPTTGSRRATGRGVWTVAASQAALAGGRWRGPASSRVLEEKRGQRKQFGARCQFSALVRILVSRLSRLKEAYDSATRKAHFCPDATLALKPRREAPAAVRKWVGGGSPGRPRLPQCWRTVVATPRGLASLATAARAARSIGWVAAGAGAAAPARHWRRRRASPAIRNGRRGGDPTARAGARPSVDAGTRGCDRPALSAGGGVGARPTAARQRHGRSPTRRPRVRVPRRPAAAVPPAAPLSGQAGPP